jgi:DNA/RNA-binding domain of Phe-tRNA-synthetase-like protein
MFEVSESWASAFAGAYAGVMVICDVTNPPRHAGLNREKEMLEAELRSRFAALARPELEKLPSLQAYGAYYKRFKKTYHVQLQLESIVFKGKSIPGAAALVEAMFMAELKNMLLTAGHDLDTLQLPVVLKASKGDESYTLLRGRLQQLKAGDMMMADGGGIISSVIYGPDQRTQIRAGTRNAMFAVYAPLGIGEQMVLGHLQDIERYVRLVAPDARVQLLRVFGRSAST